MTRKWRAKKPANRKKLAAAKKPVPPKPLRMMGAVGKCTIKAAEAADKLPTFEMHAYTGAAMSLSGWGPPVVVDLAGVQVPSQTRPILKNHDFEQIVGHSTKVTVDAQGIWVEGVVSGTGPAAAEVAANSANGFPWQASIGADALSREYVEAGVKVTVNGQEFIGPLEISRQTMLGEVSFCPLGADGATSASVAASAKGQRMSFDEYVKKCGGDPSALNDEQLSKWQKAYKMYRAAGGEDDVDADDDDDQDADKDKKASKDDDDADTKSDDKAKAKAGNLDIQAKIANDRKALAAEYARVDLIRARLKKYPGVGEVKIDGKTVSLEAHAIAEGWTADQTELVALRHDRPGINAASFGYSVSAPNLSEAVLEAAVIQAGSHTADVMDFSKYAKLGARLGREITNELKARYTDQVQQTAHTLFKGRIGLQQVLAAAAQAASGQAMPAVLRDDGDIRRVIQAANWKIQADGGSTMSIANVLSNVLNKYILAGYVFVEQTWREIASITPVRDFKPTKKINVFGDFVYKKLNADGQLINAAMSDEAFANQVDTYGRILNIQRQQIINDDMGALTQAPMLHGIGAMDGLNILFWTVWLSGMGNGPDGAAFWSARTVSSNSLGGGALNSNYISGGTSSLSSAALQIARQTYLKQVKPNGQPLGTDPEIVLVPPELQQVADELLSPKAEGLVLGTGTQARQPNINVFRGLYRPLMSRYLSNANYTGFSATAWWLLANPGVIPTIDVAFLNGQEMPTVRTLQPMNDTLGIDIQGFWDFGVAPQNTRGGIKSAGA